MNVAMRILVIILVFFHHISSFAAYGESCVALPPVAADITQLKKYTLYGEMLRNIDMSASCGTLDNNLVLCIKNNPSATTCTATTIASGANKLIGNAKVYAELFQNNSKLCLTMPTPYGHVPLMCKNLFVPTTIEELDVNRPVCGATIPACYNLGYNYSQSPFNFSGRAYQCLAGTLDRIFFKKANCVPTDGIELISLNPFSSLQMALRQAIFTLLVIYTIFYGMRIVLGEERVNLQSASMFVLKMVFVTYFAVGTKPLYIAGEAITESQNGVTDIALPILKQMTSDFANIVFTSGGARGLCSFDSAGYPNGYQYYAIWDAIDCRLAYYFGMGVMANRFPANQAISFSALALNAADITQGQSPSEPITTSVPNATQANIVDMRGDSILSLGLNGIFRIFSMMWGFLLGGNILIVICSLMFVVMILSVLIQFISGYLVCIITLYIMMYISPLFIPMILFKRTKGYFDAWLKISISCALQPAILAGFIALMLTIFDTVIYANCEFQRNTYNIEASSSGEPRSMSTFTLMVPNAEANKCTKSPGYKMMQYYAGQNWESVGLFLLRIPFIVDNLDLMGDMVLLVLFCVIFLFFAESMAAFAAEITGGPNMSSVTSSIGAVVQKVQEMQETMKDKKEEVGRKKKQDSGATK